MISIDKVRALLANRAQECMRDCRIGSALLRNLRGKRDAILLTLSVRPLAHLPSLDLLADVVGRIHLVAARCKASPWAFHPAPRRGGTRHVVSCRISGVRVRGSRLQ